MYLHAHKGLDLVHQGWVWVTRAGFGPQGLPATWKHLQAHKGLGLVHQGLVWATRVGFAPQGLPATTDPETLRHIQF